MASNLQQYHLASINSTTGVYELLRISYTPCPRADTDCWRSTDTPSPYMVPFGRNQIISQLNWTTQKLNPTANARSVPCSNMNLDLDLSSPVLEIYDLLPGLVPSYTSSGLYNENNANTDEVYLASRSLGLVRYNPTLGNCSVPLADDMSYGTFNASEYRNRALSAMATTNLESVAYIYGGINTATNGTLSISDELWALNTNGNEWISSTNATLHQIPPLYNAVIFEAMNLDPLEGFQQFLYIIGGCNVTATAFDPTDITGCLPMNVVYKTWISTWVPQGATALPVKGWVPPITKSFCSTFIPDIGLFVSGGYLAPNVTGGPPTINTASWLLSYKTPLVDGEFVWQNVTIDNPKGLASLPTVGHDCLFSAEQILFVGPTISTDSSGVPPPIYVVDIQRASSENGTATFSRGSVLNQPADYIYRPPGPSAKKWPI